MPDDVDLEVDDRRADIAATFSELSGGNDGAAQDAQSGHADKVPAARELGGTDRVLSGDSGVGDGDTAADAAAAQGGIQGDRARDDKGRFLAKPAESDKQQIPPAAKPGPAGQGAAPPVATPAAAPAFKPPQSWKPEHREKWTALPQELQAEITRRESEIARVLQQRAEAERTAQAFHETVRPYEAQIRASGANPQQYVGTLLRTAHALAYGPPQQKAELVAGLALQFGVSPQDLDGALVAKMNGQPAQQQQQMRDPRFDAFMQQLQSAKQQQHQMQAKQWQEVVGKFADTHEHFDEVGNAAADWIDLWKAKGKAITEQDLERAYDLACQGNERVSKILAQKEAAKSAATAQAATQRARNAGSSVQSRPATPVGRPANGLDDRRDDIKESIAALRGR